MKNIDFLTKFNCLFSGTFIFIILTVPSSLLAQKSTVFEGLFTPKFKESTTIISVSGGVSDLICWNESDYTNFNNSVDSNPNLEIEIRFQTDQFWNRNGFGIRFNQLKGSINTFDGGGGGTSYDIDLNLFQGQIYLKSGRSIRRDRLISPFFDIGLVAGYNSKGTYYSQHKYFRLGQDSNSSESYSSRRFFNAFNFGGMVAIGVAFRHLDFCDLHIKYQPILMFTGSQLNFSKRLMYNNLMVGISRNIKK